MGKVSKLLLSMSLFVFAFLIVGVQVNADELTKITNVDVTIALPTVGDEIKAVEEESGGEIYRHPASLPTVTLSDGANYIVDYTMYIVSAPSSESSEAEAFYGTFEADKDYYVEVSLKANEGYAFDVEYDSETSTSTDNVVITVNGEEFVGTKSQFNGGSYYMFYAKVQAKAATPVVNKYTVAFETNGGSSVSSQTVTEGEVATKPSNPTKEGYDFENWYSDKELTKAFDFTTKITADTTIYANWTKEVKEYVNVKFIAGDNSSTMSVANGDTIYNYSYGMAEKGYYIEGWYTDAEFTKAFDFDTPVTDDLTLYGKIEKTTLIKEVNLTIKNPIDGTTVTKVKKHDDKYGYDYEVYEPEPTIAINGEETYEVGFTNYINSIPTDEMSSDNAFAGTFESGKDYYVELWIAPLNGYEFADDVVVTINNGASYTASKYNNELSQLFYVTVTASASVDYQILDEPEKPIVIGEEVSFRANIDFEDFTQSGEVYVDDKLVDPSNYTATKGSTIITFKDEFLKTLGAGKHSIKIAVEDGAVSSSFTIAKTTSNPNTGDNLSSILTVLTVSIMGFVCASIYSKKRLND